MLKKALLYTLGIMSLSFVMFLLTPADSASANCTPRSPSGTPSSAWDSYSSSCDYRTSNTPQIIRSVDLTINPEGLRTAYSGRATGTSINRYPIIVKNSYWYAVSDGTTIVGYQQICVARNASGVCTLSEDDLTRPITEPKYKWSSGSTSTYASTEDVSRSLTLTLGGVASGSRSGTGSVSVSIPSGSTRLGQITASVDGAIVARVNVNKPEPVKATAGTPIYRHGGELKTTGTIERLGEYELPFRFRVSGSTSQAPDSGEVRIQRAGISNPYFARASVNSSKLEWEDGRGPRFLGDGTGFKWPEFWTGGVGNGNYQPLPSGSASASDGIIPNIQLSYHPSGSSSASGGQTATANLYSATETFEVYVGAPEVIPNNLLFKAAKQGNQSEVRNNVNYASVQSSASNSAANMIELCSTIPSNDYRYPICNANGYAAGTTTPVDGQIFSLPAFYGDDGAGGSGAGFNTLFSIVCDAGATGIRYAQFTYGHATRNPSGNYQHMIDNPQKLWNLNGPQAEFNDLADNIGPVPSINYSRRGVSTLAWGHNVPSLNLDLRSPLFKDADRRWTSIDGSRGAGTRTNLGPKWFLGGASVSGIPDWGNQVSCVYPNNVRTELRFTLFDENDGEKKLVARPDKKIAVEEVSLTARNSIAGQPNGNIVFKVCAVNQMRTTGSATDACAGKPLQTRKTSGYIPNKIGNSSRNGTFLMNGRFLCTSSAAASCNPFEMMRTMNLSGPYAVVGYYEGTGYFPDAVWSEYIEVVPQYACNFTGNLIPINEVMSDVTVELIKNNQPIKVTLPIDEPISNISTGPAEPTYRFPPGEYVFSDPQTETTLYLYHKSGSPVPTNKNLIKMYLVVGETRTPLEVFNGSVGTMNVGSLRMNGWKLALDTEQIQSIIDGDANIVITFLDHTREGNPGMELGIQFISEGYAYNNEAEFVNGVWGCPDADTVTSNEMDVKRGLITN